MPNVHSTMYLSRLAELRERREQLAYLRDEIIANEEELRLMKEDGSVALAVQETVAAIIRDLHAGQRALDGESINLAQRARILSQSLRTSA